jgi:hypothetical protein
MVIADAALQLAEYVCDAGRGQDFLVYPIVYLYRHHIELALKSIINVACFVVDYTLTKKDLYTLDHHDLAELWKLARPLLNPTCELGGSPALPPAPGQDVRRDFGHVAEVAGNLGTILPGA